MPRDYVRHSGSKRGNSSSKSGFGSALAWLLIGLILGFIFAGMIFMRKPHGIPKQYEPHPQAQPAETTTAPTPTPTTTTAAAPSTTQTQFDFYNMLPSKQTVSSTSANTNNNNGMNPNAGLSQPPAIVGNNPTTGLPNATPATSSQWMLQVGAFKNFTQADQLKAQLILAGFSAHISDATVNNVLYHRVWMGPYSNKTKAQADQQKLLQGGFKSNLVAKTS